MRVITRLLAAITLVGIAARLLPESLSAIPLAPVIVSATPWYALTAAVALVLALASGHSRKRRGAERAVLAALMVACLLLEASWQLPFFAGSGAGSAANGAGAESTDLRVMTCNVYKGRADAQRIVDLVRSEGVQVLALQETTVDFVDDLEAAGVNDLLPYSERSSSDGIYGNGVWSATPLGDTASDDIGSSASAMPAGTISVATPDGTTTPLRFVSVHTTAPRSGYWDLWRKSIEEIGVVRDRLDAGSNARYVLMGDFNSTYDHAPFREMLGGSLFDAARQAGEGLTLTWPTDRTLLPAFCGIDHVVVSGGIGTSNLETREIEGSDHAALLCTLHVR